MNAWFVDRPRRNRFRWYIPMFLVPIPVLIVLGLGVQDTLNEPASADGTCSVGSDVAHRAVFLVDLRKPVDSTHESLPGDLLDAVSKELPADTELSVFAVSAYAEAPRTLIGRMCKPYDNGDLVVEAAKDRNGSEGDCDDLPAQISGSLRTSAARFCHQREAVQRRIDALAAQGRNRVATDAYLVEALDETRRDFASWSVPTSLFIFSDMIQHAAWYSHVDVQWDEWDFDKFAAARKAETPSVEPPASPSAELPVKVFYVARAGTTASESPQLKHKRFWTSYFGNAALTFEDQPTMAGFDAEPLMDIPTPAELAAYERERVRYTSELVERERAELAETRRALELERAQFADRERELRQEQRRLSEQQRELVARQRELEARSGEKLGSSTGVVTASGEQGA
ncbi:MAG: hypothetical protein OXH68_03730 [Gammaproteobacteria bacterium]|nr:hypothetical protein [Gammaproteobacteria bacterium]